jgi:nucleotide-binding universal stress UspA family protein
MATALTFREVLFGTDFSEPSRLAGRTAAELARHFGARLPCCTWCRPSSIRHPPPRRCALPRPSSEPVCRS